jgi:hypothetical protein
MSNCTLKISIPKERPIDWTCPICSLHYTNIDRAFAHDDACTREKRMREEEEMQERNFGISALVQRTINAFA